VATALQVALAALAVTWGLVPGVAAAQESDEATAAATSGTSRFEDAILERVQEIELPNGLKILVLQRPEVPVFSAVTMVNVGAVDEHVGITGVAHIFEHMAFKGSRVLGTRDYDAEQEVIGRLDAAFDALLTERYRVKGPRAGRLAELEAAFKALQQEAAGIVVNNEYSVIVERHGGSGLNASTGSDTTQYFVSFPSNKLELWFMLEADRFREPVLREFYKEKQVVREERRMRTESSPVGQLIEEFLGAAFKAHPYGYPTIGHDSDIQTLRRHEAEAFFRKYYVPNNMVIALVGDIDPAQARAMATKYFGSLQRGPDYTPVETIEPAQKGEKRIEVVSSAQPLVGVAYHRPSALHEDDPVWDVISAVLAQGRTSRLYKRLVKEEQVALQAGAFTGFPGVKYPCLTMLYAAPGVGHTAEELEAKLIEEAEKLAEEPVSEAELARVRTTIRAGFIRGLASNQGLAMSLAQAHTIYGDWREAFLGLRKVESVTAEDIMRVARGAFTEENRSVAMIVKPEGEADAEAGAETDGEEN
jgi:predicted Zn-dependent peptidase